MGEHRVLHLGRNRHRAHLSARRHRLPRGDVGHEGREHRAHRRGGGAPARGRRVGALTLSLSLLYRYCYIAIVLSCCPPRRVPNVISPRISTRHQHHHHHHHHRRAPPAPPPL